MRLTLKLDDGTINTVNMEGDLAPGGERLGALQTMARMLDLMASQSPENTSVEDDKDHGS
jgi:hypothetical protein